MAKLTKEQLMNLDDEALKEILEGFEKIQAREIQGPQNDDELHQYFIDELGITVPRVSVCPDHDAPFTFLADVYFGRVTSALVMANRAGMKTLSVAMLHYANAENKPEYDGLTFGAIQAQSDRCYEHLEKWVKDKDSKGELKEKSTILGSTITNTKWKNGSKVEIVPGTKSAVNGPHPQVAHADEAELMKQEAWDESRNMATSKVSANGIMMPAQNIITSTRKSARGRMQQLIDEVKEAEDEGFKPPFKLYVWCIKEVTSQVSNCRMAPENVDMPEAQKCDCNLIRKGRLSNGEDRTLDKVCGGDFFKARGVKPLAEIQTTFAQNLPTVWDAQQECKRPSVENNYIPEWDEKHHCVRGFEPNPWNGPIFTATDWGAGNPNGVLWFQKIYNDVEVKNFFGDTKLLKAGSIVIFDELYEAQIGAVKLANLVKAKEQRYQNKFGPKWKPKARFADPQGRQQRIDWLDQGLETIWRTTRDFDYQVQVVQDKFVDDEVWVAEEKCENFKAEVEAWRKDDKGNQVDEFNHLMSALRYGFANIGIIEKGKKTTGGLGETVKQKLRGNKIYKKKGPMAFQHNKHSLS